MSGNDVRATVKGFILDQFLPGEDPEALTDDTPLITAGIVDSMGALRLVAYLEETFGVRIQAHEVDVEHLNTLDSIAALIEGKRGAR
jgi:acyl carrier protein